MPLRFFLRCLACCSLALLASSVWAQGVGGIGDPVTVTETSGTLSSKTMSVSVPFGNYRVLVVASSGGGNAVNAPTVTFNGRAMTQGVVATAGNSRTGLWYLPLGHSATSTTGNVVVTYNANFSFDVTAYAFQYVDQTTPVNNATTGTGATLDVVSKSGDLVVDAIVGGGAGVAVASGQRQFGSTANLVAGADPDSGVSHKAGAASTTMSWTGFVSGIAHVGLNFRQADVSRITFTNIPLPLAGGAQNVAYSETLVATGGVGAKTFSIVSGTLPPGLSLAPGGAITGVPTEGGTFQFTAAAMDTQGVFGFGSYAILIDGPPALTNPTATAITLTSAVLGARVATNGYSPLVGFVYAPTAINPNPQLNGVGVTKVAGSFLGNGPFTVNVTGLTPGTAYSYRAYGTVTLAPNGTSYSAVGTFTAETPGAVTLNQAVLPNATQNAAYSQTFSATGGVGTMTFAITAGALPGGLTLSAGGVLSGTPTASGTFNFTVTATDVSAATGSRAYALVVGAAPTFAITTRTLPNAGLNTTYSQTLVATGGTGTTTFSLTSGALPPGLSLSSAGTISGAATTSGQYNFTVTATDTRAAVAAQILSIVVGTGSPLAITTTTLTNPVLATPGYSQSIAVTGGTGSATFGITAGSLPPGLTLTLGGTISGTAIVPGTFSFTISAVDAAAATVSRTFTVVVSVPVVAGDRLVNLSSRVRIAPDATRSLIAGFVVGGTQAKRVVVRAIGPSLAQFGVTGALVNPKLQLFNSTGAIVAENEDWSGTDTTAAFTQVNAFALAAGSKDAALLATLEPGSYTMQITAGTETGITLAEVYDASPNPGLEAQRLINISARGMVEAGDGVLIGGFVIKGTSPKKVLIRGVGPQLASFGVTSPLPDPRLTVLSGQTVVAQNDNWSTPSAATGGQAPAPAAELTATAVAVGAFALAPGSLDAAVLVMLPPGSYTAQVAGAGESTGVALVEIYEVP